MNPLFLLLFLIFSLPSQAGEKKEIDKALKLYGNDVQKIQNESQSALEKSLGDVEEFLNNPSERVNPPQDSFFGFQGQKNAIPDPSLQTGKHCARCEAKPLEFLTESPGSTSAQTNKEPISKRKPSLQRKSSFSKTARKNQQIIVFVSLGMSDASLKQLALEAERYEARMVIQGLLEGSFPHTMKRIQELEIALEIDPHLFDLFKVERVPTFIRCNLHQGEPVTQGHDRLMGNIPLKNALEILKEKGTLS